ncbi:MAG: nuclear transport factor 2 family protein [Chloroflexota bacterium]
MHDPEVLAFLNRHLQSIQENDMDTYHATTSEDLTLYEWWVTPQRIDGIPFHDFMMEANTRRGTVFGAEACEGGRVRLDLSNLRIQRYGDTAIASYTMLISAETALGVRVDSHNESRVMVRLDDAWKVVHVHKSPAWQAAHMPAAIDG